MRRVVILAATVMLAACGCGERKHEAEDAVALEQVPRAAMKAAEKELPGVTFDAAWKEAEGGQTSYEIRGKTKQGKVRDVKVTADGKVMEVD